MVRRLLDSLLTVAARGWPEERRADLVREWNAELFMLELEPGLPAAVRAWRRVWFAASLVLARRTGFGGFAGRVADVERLVWPGVALFVAPFVAALPGLIVIGPITVGLASRSSVAGTVLLVVGAVIRAVIGAAVGALLARYLLGRWRGSTASVAGRVVAFAALLAGTITVGTRPAPGLNLMDDYAGFGSAVVGALTLGALFAPVGACAVIVARRVRSGRARAVLAIPTATALALASMAVTVWASGDRPAWAAGPWWWLGLLDGAEPGHYPPAVRTNPHPMELVVDRLPGVLVAAAALMLAFTVRISQRRGQPEPMPARQPPVGPEHTPAPGRWWTATLLAGAAYSVSAWAVTLTYLTPHIGTTMMSPKLELLAKGLREPWPGWSKEEGRVWMQDMQLYAIVCAVLFFLCAAAYCGLPLVPGLIAGIVLLVADVVVVRLGLFQLQPLPWLIIGALLLGLLAWRHALRIGRANPTGGQRGRPLVIAVSVLAAYLIPAPHSGWTSQDMTPITPPGLVMVVIGLPTLLAATGIVTTTQRRLTGPTWLLPVVIGIGTATLAAGWLYTPWPDRASQPGRGALLDGPGPAAARPSTSLRSTIPARFSTSAAQQRRLARAFPPLGRINPTFSHAPTVIQPATARREGSAR